MKLEHLDELNKLHNFQGTTNLCERFEKQSQQLQKLFKHNPKSGILQVPSVVVSIGTKANV